jgi:hypothetical protein
LGVKFWVRFVWGRGALLGNILPCCHKQFLKTLNVEITGGDVTGGGDKAAIGWDVVDVHYTVKTTVGRTVVSIGLVMGKKFGEKL